jgi:hypothetical protein
MSIDQPAPVALDPDTGEFFEAAKAGRLVVRWCGDCHAYVHLPAAACNHCGSWNTSWIDVAPTGRVYSWTVVERQFRAAFPVPYTVVLVELDAAPEVRLVGHLPGRPGIGLGTALIADFEHRGQTALPRWRVAETADGLRTEDNPAVRSATT